MKKRGIVLRLTVALAVAAVVLPLAAVFLISAAVLVIPSAPLIAVAVLGALFVVAARTGQEGAAGPPEIRARPRRCPLPLARARLRCART